MPLGTHVPLHAEIELATDKNQHRDEGCDDNDRADPGKSGSPEHHFGDERDTGYGEEDRGQDQADDNNPRNRGKNKLRREQ
jgi:hypothetical protein